MNTQLIYRSNIKVGAFPQMTLGNISLLEWQLIIFGGLVFSLPIVLLMGENTLWSKNPIAWIFWANALFNAPHVFSTWVRLQRKIAEKRIAKFYGLPLYICVAGILAIAVVEKLYLEVMTAISVWQNFHYARQVYGVGRFYTDRSQETVLDRKLMFWAFHLAMPLFVLGRWSVLYTAWHGKSSNEVIPVQMPDAAMALFWVLALVGLCLGLSMEFLKFRRPVYNPVGLVILLVYFLLHWFGFLSVAFYLRGFIAISIYHAIQYLGMVWINERKERKQSAPLLGLWSNASPRVSFLCFWLILFSVGFVAEHKILVWFNVYWASFAMVILSAMSTHHYAVDTIMWRAKMGQSE
jgi:hypothetical protein